jgi:hypothetical protein
MAVQNSYGNTGNQGSARLSWTRTGQITAVALLAAVAMLTTIVGPVLDHHFAERQASHGHIFLDTVQPEHGHTVDDGHGHETGQFPASGVVAIGDGDATGTTLDNAAPPVNIRSDDGDGALLLVGAVGDEVLPRGLQGSSLRRPPIS